MDSLSPLNIKSLKNDKFISKIGDLANYEYLFIFYVCKLTPPVSLLNSVLFYLKTIYFLFISNFFYLTF